MLAARTLCANRTAERAIVSPIDGYVGQLGKVQVEHVVDDGWCCQRLDWDLFRPSCSRVSGGPGFEVADVPCYTFATGAARRLRSASRAALESRLGGRLP